MARKFFYFSVMFACVMVSCARIDDTISSSQNDQPQIEDTENSTDEDGEIVDPYPHVELTDTLRIECQGDNKEEEKKESAETEGGDDTKTYLNAQNYIYWKKGDRIKIYYADGGTNYTVSEIKHGDQQTSTFDALVDKNASYYYAFYPENIKAVMTDIAGNGAFEVVIPTTQDGKFENCHLAIGKSSAEDRSFSFKNIASYMKIVVDDLTATSLTLSARDENNAIVGTLVAPFADEAGNLGSLSLKNGTGSSSVTVNLASGRKAPCTIYVALLPGVNFSQGFRLRYNYDEQTGPGFAYTSNRSIERKKILNVGTLSNRIHTDWFVKTDGTISDPSQGGNSWENALNTAGLVALLNQPTVDGVQDNALAYDKACVLDGATIHIAQGNYTLSELKLSATGYDNLVKVRILGSYPTGLTGTNTSATRDVEDNRTTFAGNGSSRILLVEDKVDLALDKLWFIGGRSAEGKTHEGGTALRAHSTAIDQASNLSLYHCGFEDNVASGQNADGGAVYLSRATAYMENCEFKNNSCGEGQIGGAINLFDDDYHTTLTLKSCQFSGNKAGLSGGAVSCSKGRLYISGTEQSPTVFEENSVTTSGRTTRGGALLLAYASSVEVEYTNFEGNYGISTGNYGTEGGAVAFAETSYGSFEHVSFVGTKGAKNAVRNGAHVSMDNTSVPAQATTFKNCSFTKGQASNVAGAIHIREYSKLSLEDCSFANNTTSNFGGAVHINNKNAQANFTDCTFSENSTKVYGGALSMEDGTCNFYNCSFTGNVGQYGAISLYFQKDVTKVSPNLNIYGCTFKNNNSTLDDNAATIDVQKSGGGAIYAGHGTVFVTSSDGTASGTRTSFTGNSAKSGGGAISLIPNNGTVAAEIKYADIEQNTASEYGGAIYANADLSMTDCILDNNSATLGASALYVSGDLTVTGSDMAKCAIRNHSESESVSGSIIRYSTTSALSFTKCKISGNVLSDMTENGAYFPLKGSNSLSMTNCEFSGNTLPISASTKYGGFAALYEGSTASLALTGTKVANCSGCKHGGAIYVRGGKSSNDGYAVDISGGSFENCSCDAYGGVINFDTPTDVAIKAQVIGTSFTGNSAGYKGGVFHLNGNGNAREILLESCTFRNNTHTGENTTPSGGGGVINMAGGKLTINSCTFSGNKSLAEIKNEVGTTGAGGGGVIYVNGTQKAELYIGTKGERVLFEGNEATAYGGAIAIFNSNTESVIDINNAKFKKNKSAAWGGGLYVMNQASLSLYNVGFTENQVTTVGNGGDALFFDGTSFTMDGSGANLNYINDQTSTYPMHTPNVIEYTFNKFDFKRNTSTRDGSLLHLDNTVARGFTITNSCLYGNSAPNNGGVIYADLHQDSRESLIQNTKIDSNQVTNKTDGLGGAIYWNCFSWDNGQSQPGLKIWKSSTLCKNKAGKSGSAVYLLKGHLHCEEITMNENTFHTLDSKDDDYGGTIAMCHNMSKVDFNSSVAHNNVSTGKGGVFHIRGGRLFANNIQADNNSANTRGGFIFQTSHIGSEGFVLIQKSSFVGNHLRYSDDMWGKFSHANSNNNGMHAMMISRCTIDDGNTSRPGAVINGAPNLLLLGTTVYANSTSAAVRLEGGQMALLLNNLILNRETSAPSLLQNGSFSFSDKSCYNVMGTVSATAYGNYTGDQKGKTSANLGSWAWNATNRVYTWDGKVGGTAVETPAIDYTNKSDNISKAFDEGFMFDYSQNDNNKFNVTQSNIGQRLRDYWGSGSYYTDQLGTARTYNGHYPGSYTK